VILTARWRFTLTNFFLIFKLSKKGCQQNYQIIVKLPQNISLHSCVFYYLGIHDAFPLVYFSFNKDLKPDFKVFGNVFIFCTKNFLIKTDLTSALSSSLHVYYKFRRLVIKKLLQGDDSRFFTPGVTWVHKTFSLFTNFKK
jgi:hypothetical protein